MFLRRHKQTGTSTLQPEFLRDLGHSWSVQYNADVRALFQQSLPCLSWSQLRPSAHQSALDPWGAQLLELPRGRQVGTDHVDGEARCCHKRRRRRRPAKEEAQVDALMVPEQWLKRESETLSDGETLCKWELVQAAP